MAVVLLPNGVATRRLTHWRPRRRQSQKTIAAPVRCCCRLKPRSLQRNRRLTQCTKQKRTNGLRTQSFLGFISNVSPSQDFFEAAINSLVGGSAMICFALAFVPLLAYEDGDHEQVEIDEMETVKWSVASVVSCFPYLNWTSWLLIAFDSDPPLPYYFLSALYLIPFLRSGFDFNSFSVFMFVLSILHMQVERVAQTEPAILGTAVEGRSELASMVGQISQSINQQLPAIVAKSKLLSGKGKNDLSISEMVDEELIDQQKELQNARELARMEQQFWDEKLEDGREKN